MFQPCNRLSFIHLCKIFLFKISLYSYTIILDDILPYFN
ncbi:hypothetical protein FM106_31390 [Brachybacterium faecium]|nr:hypothetical protein FM106_31390 [Brachybacterium faecium]